MKTHSDVIKELGGYMAVADALGLPSGTVSSWQTRDSISPEHWPAVAAFAVSIDKPAITTDLLAGLRSQRSRRERIPAEPAS